MYWKFPSSFMGGNQNQQIQSNMTDIPTHSWYPPSVTSSSPSSHPSTPSSYSNASFPNRDRPQSLSCGQPSPAEAAGIIPLLKDKSVDDLRKLLNDPDTYAAFFKSLDQVKTQNNVCDELQKETLQLARENLEKEPRILELRNQCMIIRTTQLAAAQEKLNELERQKEETLKFYSPASFLQKLHDAMENTEEESEVLQRQLLAGETDITSFVQKYKKLRTLHHRRALIHLSAKTNL